MSLSVIEVGLSSKDLLDAVKASTTGEVVILTSDNKALKIQSAKLTPYNTVPVNSLKKLLK